MSELYVWSKNGNKMIINSDFKEFNKQTNYIGSGNVIASTQKSMYIRNRFETECNGIKYNIGYLQDYDLQYFRDIPKSLRDIIHNSDKKMVLYEFYIMKKHGDYGYIKDTIGWLLQEDNKITQLIIASYSLRKLAKRYSALQTCKAIIEEKI